MVEEGPVPTEKAVVPAESADRGQRLYSEVGNKKARRVRLMLSMSGALTGIGCVGTAVIVLIFAFYAFQFPFAVQAIGALLAGALLYWSFLGFRDYMHMRVALKPLRVYERGMRLPCGSDYDISHGHPPRFIHFSEVDAFYPNEGEIDLSEFAIALKDPEEDAIVVPKELIGHWGRFRGAVKERMQTRKGWVYLKGEGPLFAGHIEADDLRLSFGLKEQPQQIPWDSVFETPKIKLKAMRNLVVLTVRLRAGGKLKFLMPLSEAEGIVKSYKKYVNRFWKEPEKEERRWEEVEESDEEEEA